MGPSICSWGERALPYGNINPLLRATDLRRLEKDAQLVDMMSDEDRADLIHV